MPRRWGLLFVLAFLLLASFTFGIPKGYAASGGKLIIINKANNRLAYYDNGRFIREFKVGTGRSNSLTPEGKFKIVNKIVNRPYYKGHIPGGDPRNPLGNRWLGLNARGTWGTTYAIHGNNNPSSIGGYVSSGCIRMYDNEVEWLFSQVPINTPVVITSSGKSFNTIAAANGYRVSGGAGTPAVPVITNGGILMKGSQGPAVMELQRKLTSLGYNTKGTDGIFGVNTENALRQFQKARSLTVDGIVGPATKKALGIK
ncbi:L,D-transpeptidase family protein [Neobacillus drentensis]|uniref:L,D-transpeptidase family protein n=1 Tax=Neobacillus drentensis TaxID=220684 RepID=UPI00300297EC